MLALLLERASNPVMCRTLGQPMPHEKGNRAALRAGILTSLFITPLQGGQLFCHLAVDDFGSETDTFVSVFRLVWEARPFVACQFEFY